MSKPNSPSRFVSDAYCVENRSSMLDFYRKWAQDYDLEMQKVGYIAPKYIAGLLAENLPDRDAPILDIGCGTGLTGATLAAEGYAVLDGLDISSDMISVARQRSIYRCLFIGDLNQPLDIGSASYRGIVSSGTFTHGHVGPEPLDEMFRILAPAAILACTVHSDLWESHGFDTKFDALVRAGTADCLTLERGVYFDGGDPEGWFCVYQKR